MAQVESGGANVTISTLVAFAVAYDVLVSVFFEPQQAPSPHGIAAAAVFRGAGADLDDRVGTWPNRRPGKPMAQDFRAGLMRLVLDPLFAAFERLANRPNLFRIVGRTYTETWHSMLLGWLLDPQGSHGLGDFALRRLLLAAADNSAFGPDDKRAVAMSLAVFGEFGETKVSPNERNPSEQPIRIGDQSGRLDVFVSGIKVSRPTRDAVIAIEQKVFAPPDSDQCRLYSAWMDVQHKDKIHIPILVAPVEDREECPIDDERWFVLDYQSLHDDVLVPALEHPDLSSTVRPLIEQYTDALRIPMDGTKLAVSQEEKDLANDLFKRHEQTFQALFEVLTMVTDSPQLQALVAFKSNAGKQPISLKANGELVSGSSGAEFLKNVVVFLDQKDQLQSLVPFSSGPKRYLVAASPRHLSGRDFESPAEVATRGGSKVFVETNSSRNASLTYALKLFKKAGYATEVVNA